jgi:hypothetical protein
MQRLLRRSGVHLARWPSSSIARTRLAYPDRVSAGEGCFGSAAFEPRPASTVDGLARAMRFGQAGTCELARISHRA